MLIRRARNSARISAAHSNKHQGPRSISRALKENTARHTISRATRSSGEPPDCGPKRRSVADRPHLPMELPLSRKPVERDGDDYKRLKAAMARRLRSE